MKHVKGEHTRWYVWALFVAMILLWVCIPQFEAEAVRTNVMTGVCNIFLRDSSNQQVFDLPRVYVVKQALCAIPLF